MHARYRSGGDALSLTFANTGRPARCSRCSTCSTARTRRNAHRRRAPSACTDSFQGDASGDYHLEAHGPNGFLRVFRGNLRRDLAERKAPLPEVRIDYEPLFGNLRVQLINRGRHPVKLTVKDNVYRQGERRTVNVPPGQRRKSIFAAQRQPGTTSASARRGRTASCGVSAVAWKMVAPASATRAWAWAR